VKLNNREIEVLSYLRSQGASNAYQAAFFLKIKMKNAENILQSLVAKGCATKRPDSIVYEYKGLSW